MATHTQLPIYKAAYDLLGVVADLVKNMPRDFKRSIGEKISAECIEITVLVFRANVAQDKAPHHPPADVQRHKSPERRLRRVRWTAGLYVSGS